MIRKTLIILSLIGLLLSVAAYEGMSSPNTILIRAWKTYAPTDMILTEGAM